jgi:hypothetical protein
MNSCTKRNPIIVVGQPRSGSTILTRVLNESPELFVINDFYILQRIDAEKLWRELSPAQAARIAKWIYRIIEFRAAEEVGKTLEQPIHLSMEHLAQVKSRVYQQWPNGLYWNDVLADVMSFAARLAGANRWGYNTPQDHFHLNRLVKAYPDCAIILQLRQPEPVLKSYKNVSGWWHDPRRYNPVSIAVAWRAAANSYERFRDAYPSNILFIRFEELVSETSATVQRLNNFLDISLEIFELSSFGKNSSHSRGSPRLPVTGTEILVCESVIGASQTRLGFAKSSDARLSVKGLYECARLFGGTVSLFWDEYLFNRDLRKRLTHLFVR